MTERGQVLWEQLWHSHKPSELHVFPFFSLITRNSSVIPLTSLHQSAIGTCRKPASPAWFHRPSSAETQVYEMRDVSVHVDGRQNIEHRRSTVFWSFCNLQRLYLVKQSLIYYSKQPYLHSAAVSCTLKVLQNTLRSLPDIGRWKKVSPIVKPFQKYRYIKFWVNQNVKSNLAFKFPLKPFIKS